MNQLTLFNTLSKKKEPFDPLDPAHIRMYVCGPTVYDLAHLGNARPVVVFDVLYRLIKDLYPKVTYVRNITDVDDKINAAAKASGEPISMITERTTKAYHQDMEALNALSPDHEPRATGHIGEMIAMIETLIQRGFAYANQGHALFSPSKFAAYGHLSRRSMDEMIAGARIEVAPYKEHPEDFVLWKPSTQDEPGWESPWGFGRPGWHIECSAMSAAYLGETFDIHGGGVDLVFPHHENEIAQSCAAHGTPIMAKYWMHNGHLMVKGAKMSKSLGNFFTVRDLLKDYDGEVIRYAMLSTHYRQPLDWQDETLPRAKQSLDKLYRIFEENTGDSGEENHDSPEILSALQDDLNTPLALSHMNELINRYHKEKSSEVVGMLKGACSILGIGQRDPIAWFKGSIQERTLSEGEINDLLEKRQEARKNRDFAMADHIRKTLDDVGIVIEDTPQGVKWRTK